MNRRVFFSFECKCIRLYHVNKVECSSTLRRNVICNKELLYFKELYWVKLYRHLNILWLKVPGPRYTPIGHPHFLAPTALASSMLEKYLLQKIYPEDFLSLSLVFKPEMIYKVWPVLLTFIAETFIWHLFGIYLTF